MLGPKENHFCMAKTPAASLARPSDDAYTVEFRGTQVTIIGNRNFLAPAIAALPGWGEPATRPATVQAPKRTRRPMSEAAKAKLRLIAQKRAEAQSQAQTATGAPESQAQPKPARKPKAKAATA